jgi:hypothetical protein
MNGIRRFTVIVPPAIHPFKTIRLAAFEFRSLSDFDALFFTVRPH